MEKFFLRLMATLIAIIVTICCIALLWAARAALVGMASVFAGIVITLTICFVLFAVVMGILVAHRFYIKTHIIVAPKDQSMRFLKAGWEKIKESRLLNGADVSAKPTLRPLPKPGVKKALPVPSIVMQEEDPLPGQPLRIPNPPLVFPGEEDAEPWDTKIPGPFPMIVPAPPLVDVSPLGTAEPDEEDDVLIEDDDVRYDDLGIERVTFASIAASLKKRIAAGKILLARTEKGYLFGELETIVACNVVGKPGYGKTSFLYFIIAQMMMLRFLFKQVTFTILDPHATLMPIKGLFPYTEDLRGIMAELKKIEREFQDRKARYLKNGSKCTDDPYVLIIDELHIIVSHEAQLRSEKKDLGRDFIGIHTLLDHYVNEGRKFNMYLFLGSQSMPVDVLPSRIRGSLTSHFVFYCPASQARMAGLEEEGMELRKKIKFAGSGVCIVDAARVAEAKIGYIPLTTAQDIFTLAQELGFAPTHSPVVRNTPATSAPSSFSRHRAQPLRPMEVFADVGPVEQELVNEIVRIAGQVKTRAEIVPLLPEGYRKAGSSYKIVKAVCDSRRLLTSKAVPKPQEAVVLAGDGRPQDKTQSFDSVS